MDPAKDDSSGFGTNLITLLQRELDENPGPRTAYMYLGQCLHQYSLRDLTYDYDAINALGGMLRRVSVICKTQILQGIPEQKLPIFLDFLMYGTRRRPMFPSWSWSGWKGEVFHIDLDDSDLVSEIVFETIGKGGITREVWCPDIDTSDRVETTKAECQLTTTETDQPRTLRSYSLLKFTTQVFDLPCNYVSRSDSKFDGMADDYGHAPHFVLLDGQQKPIGFLFYDLEDALEAVPSPLRLAVLGRGGFFKPQLSYSSTFKRHQLIKDLYMSETVRVLHLIEVEGVWERRGIGSIFAASILSNFDAWKGRTETIFLG